MDPLSPEPYQSYFFLLAQISNFIRYLSFYIIILYIYIFLYNTFRPCLCDHYIIWYSYLDIKNNSCLYIYFIRCIWTFWKMLQHTTHSQSLLFSCGLLRHNSYFNVWFWLMVWNDYKIKDGYNCWQIIMIQGARIIQGWVINNKHWRYS